MVIEAIATKVEDKTWFKIWEVNYRFYLLEDYDKFCQLQSLFNKSTATYAWFTQYIFRTSINRYSLQNGLHIN